MRSGLLWFGVLAAPFAWVAQLVSGYGLEEASCPTGAGVSPVLDADAEPAIGAITVVAVVVALAGALAALLSRRAAAHGDADPRGRAGFVAGAGLLSSLIFLAVIVLGGVALLTFDSCHPG